MHLLFIVDQFFFKKMTINYLLNIVNSIYYINYLFQIRIKMGLKSFKSIYFSLFRLKDR